MLLIKGFPQKQMRTFVSHKVVAFLGARLLARHELPGKLLLTSLGHQVVKGAIVPVNILQVLNTVTPPVLCFDVECDKPGGGQ